MDKKSNRVGVSRPGAPPASRKPPGRQTSAEDQSPSSHLSPKSGSSKQQLQSNNSKGISTAKVVPMSATTAQGNATNKHMTNPGSKQSLAPAMAPLAGQIGAALKSKLPQQFSKKPTSGSPQKSGAIDNDSFSAAQGNTAPGQKLRPFKSKQSVGSSSDDYSVSNLKGTNKAPAPRHKKDDRSQHSNWRERADRMAIYNLQKRFKFDHPNDTQIRELVAWKDKDSKGKRKTLYVKEVQKKTDLILHVTDQSRLEQNMNYEDRWPMLNLRKEAMRIRIYINLAARTIIDHRAFETVSIIVILLNSLTLASEDPTSDETTPTAQFIDDVFLMLYSVEMFLKIVGMGFIFGKGAYLRDSWNILDFVIVGSAYLTIVNDLLATEEEGGDQPEGLSLNSLRAFRVLRPLRAITTIKGLRVLVLAVLSALPLLKETMVVLIFFFLIFAIAATQLLTGALKQRCVSEITGIAHEDDMICGGREQCEELPGFYCGKQNQNPNFGVTNFDNILYALLAVFQCITLEGWSDIQKMYMEAYSNLVWILFLPIVFMGAFFLLNLTLAVINSSFNRTHKQFQEKEMRAREAARKQRVKKSRSDDTERVIGDEPVEQIGVAEYFIAKRAARKMIEFLRDRQIIRAEEKLQERDIEDIDELEQQYEALGLPPPGTSVLPTSTDQKKVGLDLQLENGGKDNKQASGKKDSEMLASGSPGRLTAMMEDEQQDNKSEVSEAHSDQVKRFLQELLDETNTANDKPGKPAQENKIKMAVMNFAQDKPRNISRVHSNLNTKITPQIQAIHTADADKQGVVGMPGAPLMQGDLKGNVQRKKVQSKYTGLLSEESRFDDLLDIDKVIANHEANQNTRVKQSRARASPNGSSGSGEHPFDLSFLQSGLNDYPDFSEDEGFNGPKGAGNTGMNGTKGFDNNSVKECEGSPGLGIGDDIEIQDKDSVIGSDTSLHEKIQDAKNQKLEALNRKVLEQTNKTSQPYLEPAKKAILQKLKEQLQRMQNQDDRKKEEVQKKRDALNNTQSTFDGKQDSMRQMLKDEAMTNALSDEMQNQKANNADKTMSLMNQTLPANQVNTTTQNAQQKKGANLNYIQQRRENFKDVVNSIDETFLSKQGQEDPYNFIDKKLQKIEINRGIAYRSTSHDDVFEIRNKIFDAQAMSMANAFVSQVESGPAELQDPDVVDKLYIKPQFEPWQLKNFYEIKNEEQIDFESDDEDALILALQPYDTVMNVGYSHLLTQIPTKFRARRSDIIVSSTLSITLSPCDGDYQVKDLGLMQPAALSEWCDKRNEFRASNVKIFAFRDEYNQSSQNRQGRAGSGVPPPLNKQKFMNSRGMSSVNLAIDQGSSSARNSGGINGSEEDDNETFKPIKESAMGSNNQSNSFDNRSKASDIKLFAALNKSKMIPPSLLSKVLPSDKLQMLSDEEKKQYNNQKNKWECALRQQKKQPVHPSMVRYFKEDAILMLHGKYQDQEDEDEQFELDRQMKQNANVMYMSRDETFTGKNQDFEAFTTELKNIVARPRFDFSKIKGDNIPRMVRNELDLPDELEGNQINFDEVRRKDANVKRRKPMWSGQDVLDVGLTPDQASWVVGFLNPVRVWPYGSYGIFKRYRVSLKKVVKHSFFDNLMTTAVLLNTVVMAMERYNMPVEEQILLEKINQIFTWLFIFELFSKLIAVGLEKYLADRMNWLDGAVVCISIMEIVLVSVLATGGGLSAFKTIRVLRTFRILRVARLLRALESMQVIIAVIQKSAGSFMYITMLLFVFIFIFTLLGMQLFGGRFDFPDSGKPRGNYDTFNIALVTVFQVLTMENWQTVLFDSMRSDEIGLIVPAVFYIVWIFVGNFILLNLFLAILLDSFLEEDEGDEDDVLEAERQAKKIRQEKIDKEKQRRMKKLGTTMFKSGSYQQWKDTQTLKQNQINSLLKKNPEEVLIEDIDDLEEQAIREIFMDEGIIKKKDKERERLRLYSGVECQFSMYIFDKKNCYRLALYKLQKNKIFDNTIMGLIGLSSFKLAADTYYNHLPSTDTTIVVSEQINLFLNFAFLFECVTKITALGFVMDNGSYLRESWNQLDLFIVVTSMLDMMLTGVDLPIIKILRLLRTLRPLRVISHNVAMKLIVSSLMESVGAIFNVVIVVVAVWLMFAIFAINIFAGKFFYCSYDVYQNHDKYECNVAGGSWIRYDSNFDDVFQAMMTLFIVASLEGWPDIMLAAVDSTYVDKGPTQEYSPLNAYFFLIFILIGSFFLLNFFIGVLFLKYAQAQKNETKGYTQAHLTWKDIQTMIIKAECPHDISNKPQTPFRIKIWKIVNSNTFDLAIMGTIIANIVQMAVSYQGMPAWYLQLLEGINYIFTVIFLAEAILKITAYGWSYFGTAWNKFDFFVVCSSLLDIVMDQMDAEQMQTLAVGPQLAKILRVLRVTRVLRLAGKNEGLQALMQTITMSVGSLANVFLLLVLVLFIFSILGVFFFQELNSGDVIDGYKNFNNFGESFLLLFAISTGEDWNKLMYDCVDTPPNCIQGETCGSSLAPAYYIIFVMIVSNVMLNLFILVIIQQFELYYVSDDNPIQKFKTNLDLFMKTWIAYTAKRYKCVKIREKQLHDFFKTLPPPIGLTDDTTEAELKKTMLKMGIRCDDGYIYFNELLYRCMRRQYGNFKLNKRMQIVELKTQYKIYYLTLRSKNMAKLIKNQELFFQKMIGNDKAVNPFVQKMYYRISFNTWLNVMRKQERRDRHDKEMDEARDRAMRLDMPFIEQPLQEEAAQYMQVTIEIEKVEMFTSEEESFDDEEEIPALSGQGSKEGLQSIKGSKSGGEGANSQKNLIPPGKSLKKPGKKGSLNDSASSVGMNFGMGPPGAYKDKKSQGSSIQLSAKRPGSGPKNGQ